MTPRSLQPTSRRAYAGGHRLVPVCAAAAAVLAGCALPGAAHGALVVGALRSPDVANASTKEIIYYFDLRAGESDERFSLHLTPPSFATIGGETEGQSLDGPVQVVMQIGPGTVGQVSVEPSFASVCSSRLSAFHGYSTGIATIDLALPANSSNRLAVRYVTGRRAPWIDTNYGLRFSTSNDLVGTYAAPSPLAGGPTRENQSQTLVKTPAIAVAPVGKAKIGAHLIVNATPKGGAGEEDTPRTVKRGSSVLVNGRLLPASKGKRVQLQWATVGGQPRTAKTVTTREGGRFTTRLPVPNATGVRELWAAYPTQPGKLTSDSTSCPITYKLR